MPLFRDINTLYIHVPKTGGVSIDFFLAKYSSIDYYAGDNTICSYEHYTPNMLKSIISDYDNLIKFATFRNPYDRIVSLYHWSGYDKELSFNEFIIKVKEYFQEDSWIKYFDGIIDISLVNKKKLDAILLIDSCHLLPQHYYYRENIEVLKFENLNAQFNTFLRKINLPNNEYLDKFNTSTHDKYHKYYDQKTNRDIIYTIYKKDFEILNYPFYITDN